MLLKSLDVVLTTHMEPRFHGTYWSIHGFLFMSPDCIHKSGAWIASLDNTLLLCTLPVNLLAFRTETSFSEGTCVLSATA